MKTSIKNNESLFSYFKRIVRRKKHKPYSLNVKIKDIENCKSYITEKLIGKHSFKNYIPRFLNTDEQYIETVTPEISLYQFQNVQIDIKSSALLLDDELIVYRSKEERFNEGFVTSHDDDEARIDIKVRPEELEEGFFLGGNGSWNWFHFLIEIMPKLILLNGSTTTLLVNEIVLEIPSMKKVLEIATENKFEIKYLNPEKTYFVQNLYYINDFNRVQFNRFDGLIKAEGMFYNLEITRSFSNLLLDKLSISKDVPEKIFLYRKNTHRIAENQDQILEYLQNFGFVPVCLEELSIDEQASYFQQAKFIIGISGAAWSNMLFCRNRPKAICFIPDNAKEFSAFSNLAKIFEVNYYAQLYINDGAHTNSNFMINFDEFIELFNDLNEKE